MTYSHFMGKLKMALFGQVGSFFGLTSVRASVRPSVRACVTRLLENRSLLFSETLQLVRACKREKNVTSAFLKKIPVLPMLAKNCPKLAILAQNAQKWRFFRIFFAIRLLEFSNFLY